MSMITFTPTGVDGIDDILHGGLPAGSSIILEGAPGTGKTTLGVQFLHHGATRLGEAGIYVTFEEFPQQIYKVMLGFGWDLKKLEGDGLLRVVSVRPDVLFHEMKKPGGLFEQLIGEIGAKRVVVDTISLFHYLYKDRAEAREAFYTLCNVFRKHGLTALLLSEQTADNTDRSTFEHYVADGVIRLSMSRHMETFRKRTLEITKMRGVDFTEGEHIFRIMKDGIHLVPALTMVEDGVIMDKDKVPTGIPELDGLLAGGIPRGSSMILDTNSKANYKYITASILAGRIRAGERIVVVSSHAMTVAEQHHLLRQFGIDTLEVARRKGVYFIEHYDRTIPPELEDCVINVKDVRNEDYYPYVNEKLQPVVQESIARGEKWFVYQDLSVLYTQRGADFVKHYYSRDSAMIRAMGMTALSLCNFTEIGPENASYLERATQTVVRTWVDRNYQYLQVTKSATGKVSAPMIVETVPVEPFIRLV
jgi:circadian clock protein KaiC